MSFKLQIADNKGLLTALLHNKIIVQLYCKFMFIHTDIYTYIQGITKVFTYFSDYEESTGLKHVDKLF